MVAAGPQPPASKRLNWWIPSVLGAGLAAGFAAYVAAGGPPPLELSRPDASGAPGQVTVYGQLASGPIRLSPGRRNVLPRPQALVFAVEVDGTGPRDIRIEVEIDGARQVLFEDRLEAPLVGDYLGFSVPLDERIPDRLTLLTVVEPPHDLDVVTRYPIRLVGSRTQLRE